MRCSIIENPEVKYYYIIVETSGQRLFVNQDGDYSDKFEDVMRFYSRIDAVAYITNHINNAMADIIGVIV